MTQEAQWDEVELPDIIKDWEVNDSQEGTFIDRITLPGNEGKTFEAGVWRREDGTSWSTALSAGLAPLMRDVPYGTYTRVTMTEERDTGRPAPMKVFKVLKRR